MSAVDNFLRGLRQNELVAESFPRRLGLPVLPGPAGLIQKIRHRARPGTPTGKSIGDGIRVVGIPVRPSVATQVRSNETIYTI